VNEIRRECPALTSGEEVQFYPVSDEHLIAYGRVPRSEGDPVVVVVNLDPHYPHEGWLELPLEQLGIEESESFQAHDLLGGARFLWQGRSNYVLLDPRSMPAHIFRIRRRVRTERDFDYYL
jgi:starch synthase (maltosyl-transferring)